MADGRRGPLTAVNDVLAALLRALLVIAVAVLVIPVSLQIFSRYTALIPSYIWTEEMARFLFVWAIMLGAMLGVREGTHLLVDLWPPGDARRQALLDLLADLAIAVLAGVFLWWGWRFTEGAFYRISELAELPMWLIHMAWPITGLVWVLFLLERVLEDLRILRGRGP
jgi:TRAP-type C4-dicarboxylate transport system permease small subunit